MKKLLFIVLIILSMGLLIGCNESTGNVSPDSIKLQPVTEEIDKFQGNITFRNVGWGITVNQVKKAEKITIAENPSSPGQYFGQVQLDGNETVVFYQFIDEKLEKSGYLFTHDHMNNTDYITDFMKVKENIISKYGKPTKDDMIWKGDLWKDDPQQYGMAVVTGNLIYLTQWNLGDTDISLLLAGDNFEVKFGVTYQSKDFANKEKQMKNQSNNSNY